AIGRGAAAGGQRLGWIDLIHSATWQRVRRDRDGDDHLRRDDDRVFLGACVAVIIRRRYGEGVAACRRRCPAQRAIGGEVQARRQRSHRDRKAVRRGAAAGGQR